MSAELVDADRRLSRLTLQRQAQADAHLGSHEMALGEWRREWPRECPAPALCSLLPGMKEGR